MNIFNKIVVLVILCMAIVSCNPNDTNTPPLRDYSEQYVKDIAAIEEYLQTHYMEVVNNPGATDDQSVTYTLIPEGGTQTSIWDQTEYPLQTRLVLQNDIVYKIYYLQLRQGSGPNSKSPCNVDQVLTSYRGEYIYTSTETVDEVEVKTIKSTQFEESINPQTYFNLTGVIKGWSEIFPLFKTGSYTGNPDGTVSYFDFGAGVMFIPSGLAYYSASPSSIPSYSPLIFSFKLYEIQRTDQDNDGISSFQEDIATSVVNADGTVTIINGIPDGYMNVLAKDVVNPDDTDGDEKPDFLDFDDDDDLFTTKSEIKNPLTNEPFPFALIPTCSDGKKKHLSNVCH
ncbi:FKBP-type peptidyl-prolyl cis-trans isomerase [Flavobacterium sp. RSB2_4_14]|uniref:FKBP-type peptidyl-prolyl cis-trans isomerase n=1 Tax=Flavobacterium sp. RSB2_4_14 TaxID=3447665 RepID=UPI003F345D47